MKDKVVIRSSFKDVAAFSGTVSYRSGVINEASTELKPINYAVNSSAALLHPTVQYLKIKNMLQLAIDLKLFVLEPDASKGTASLAYFRPGQYLPIKIKNGSSYSTETFTICSSPLDSTRDEYLICVKKLPFDPTTSFIFDNWQKGTQLLCGAPEGSFCYTPIRDEKSIIGITDDIGAGAFYSMANAVCDGILDINLTLIYGCRKKSEAVFMNELIALSEKTDKLKPVFVFSDEKVDKCERGFITKALLEKYLPESKRFSVFINGTSKLYAQTAPHISSLRIEKKFIRFGSGGFKDESMLLTSFPENSRGKVFLCKVIKNNETYTLPCRSDEPLIKALEREGIDTHACCKTGECGECRAKLLKGNVHIPKLTEHRKKSDITYGIIYTCVSYPLSNITISIE